MYGRKKVLCGGLFWLLAFTLGCAFVRGELSSCLVPLTIPSSHSCSDDISLDVLRAIQGIGAAAIIPASVSALSMLLCLSSNRQLVRYTCRRVPSFEGPIYRVCNVCRWSPFGRCRWNDPGRFVDTAYTVRHVVLNTFQLCHLTFIQATLEVYLLPQRSMITCLERFCRLTDYCSRGLPPCVCWEPSGRLTPTDRRQRQIRVLTGWV